MRVTYCLRLSCFMKKTLVTGASENPTRYSNMAIHSLRRHKFEVVALGIREGNVLDVPILTGMPNLTDVDVITLYLSEKNQKMYESYFIDLHPKKIIFNPGTDNPSLEKKALDAGIEVFHECTLVLLTLGSY